MEPIPLFRSQNLQTLMNQHGNHIVTEVASISEDVLLNTPTHDSVKHLMLKNSFSMIELEEPRQRISDAKIPSRMDVGDYVAVKRCTLAIPYKGDKVLFMVFLSSYNSSAPWGIVDSTHIRLQIDVLGNEKDRLKQKVDSAMDNLNRYLNVLRDDVHKANTHLSTWATDAVEQRKKRILENRELEAFLAYPVSARTGVESYAVPLTCTSLPFAKAESALPYVPHPTISISDYDHIIKVLQGMGIMMERAGPAFTSMNEEALRHVFLGALNTHFEDQATGETFNSSGKTDILIKNKEGILFIAECKFWSGPKSLSDAIDQVLSYLTWRESKAAIIIFNRNRQISTILNAIPGILKDHAQWKRTVHETTGSKPTFQYVLKHPADSSIEITLTVLAFNLPHTCDT